MLTQVLCPLWYFAHMCILPTMSARVLWSHKYSTMLSQVNISFEFESYRMISPAEACLHMGGVGFLLAHLESRIISMLELRLLSNILGTGWLRPMSIELLHLQAVIKSSHMRKLSNNSNIFQTVVQVWCRVLQVLASYIKQSNNECHLGVP